MAYLGRGWLAVIFGLICLTASTHDAPSTSVLEAVAKRDFDRTCSVSGAVVMEPIGRKNCYQQGSYRVWYEPENDDVHFYVGEIEKDDTVTTALIFRPDRLLKNNADAVSYMREHFDQARLIDAFVAPGASS